MEFNPIGEVCLPGPVFMGILSGMSAIIGALWRSRERAIRRQDERYDRLLDHAEKRIGVDS